VLHKQQLRRKTGRSVGAPVKERGVGAVGYGRGLWNELGVGTRAGLLVLALALLLRLGLLAGFAHQPPVIVDEQQYNAIAVNLAQHGEYADGKGRPTALRPPLYPLLLAAVYAAAGGESYVLVRAVQVLLGLALGVICFFWARRLFDAPTARLAAAISLLYPSLVLFEFLLLTEVVFTVLFLLACASLGEHWGGRSRLACFGWAGLLLGLASLTRSITYPLLVPLALLVVALSPGRRWSALRGVALLTVVFALTLSPWVARNFRVFGQFVPVDTMGGWNLYLGNFAHTQLHRAWATIDERGPWYEELRLRLGGLDEAQKQEVLAREGVEYIKAHPGTTALRSVIKAANLWGLDRTVIAGMRAGMFPALRSPPVQVVVAASILLSFAALVIGGVFGLVWRLWRERRPGDVLMGFLVAYFTLMHGLVFGHPRYLLPLVPVLGGYLAWALVHRRSIRHDGPAWKAVLGGVCAVFATVWAYDLFIGSREAVETLLRNLLA
jgi:4-amino-4-deoxy-L-arabinose transferase-like glycosyltransferase